MPIITKKDGWTNISTPIYVGPDREGEFVVNSKYDLIHPPVNLDPLGEFGVKAVLAGNIEPIDIQETLTLDYQNAHPTNKELLLKVTGLGLYHSKFYLSSEGNGAKLGGRPQPQPRAHIYEIVSFTPIRNESEYRRRREGDIYSGDVIGWETHQDYQARKHGKEHRV